MMVIFLSLACQEDKSTKESTPSKPDSISEKQPVDSKGPLFEYLSKETTNIDFKNQIQETERFNFLLYEYLYNGGGVAVGDINNDGLDDIYFTGNTITNKLYLNQGDFKFKDITESAGVNGGVGFKTGVTMADVNNDGYLDIYVCKSALSDEKYRRNILYINNGDLTFTERAKAYGLDDPGYSVQAYFFDSDGDNDLDVFVLNHPSNMRESNVLKVTQNEKGEIVRAVPTEFEYISDRFYENNNSSFIDISKKAGVMSNTFGLSAVVGDFNNDFRPDFYVCNDYMKPDRLFINKGNNRFEDQIEDYFSHTSFSSMGSDFADINNNGHMDLFTLDMSPKKNDRRKMMMMIQNYDKYEKMTNYGFGRQFQVNAFQINTGNGAFSDIAFLDNLAQTEWSWSVLFADFDNDGLKDVHITNGYNRDVTNNDYARYRMDLLQKQLNAKQITLKQWIEEIPSIPVPAFIFKNKGANRFTDVSDKWNSGPATFSNGSAYSDLNNDGYLDVVVNNINDFPFIMKNMGKSLYANDYLSIKFKPNKGQTAIGAMAKLTLSNGTVITEQYNPTRGFLSSSQHKLHFGVPKGVNATQLEIIWPDKQVQVIDAPTLNQTLSIAKNRTTRYQPNQPEPQFFRTAKSKFSRPIKHKENSFIDFKREILLHHKLSEEGPAAAVADVNGDGLDDFYIGGAIDHPGQLFLQNNSGSFYVKSINDFNSDKIYEDVDAVFFDANNDGHLDLFVVSGGNEYESNSENYKDRLYLNDGKGGFNSDKNAIPDLYNSGSSVAVHDINGDGQLDLFVGSRSVPGRYPEQPKSYLLENQNGTFVDATSKWLQNDIIGMITDAEFADLNNDNVNELILSGEWMPITVYEFDGTSYSNATSKFGLNSEKGWWKSITISDINNDGFNDVIGGNLGLNSIFKASKKEPVTLYYKDFDNNGSVDPILCTYIEGVSYPIHNRDRMLNHMVMLKKRFTRYEPYSIATINDIFTPQELQDVNILSATNFKHSLFMNNSGNGFAMSSLPTDTQISVLNDAVIMDVNNDGLMDIISGGNFYGTDVEFGRYDASVGSLSLNTPSGLRSIPSSVSGLRIPGNVRQIKPINVAGKPFLLIIRNNEEVSMIELID